MNIGLRTLSLIEVPSKIYDIKPVASSSYNYEIEKSLILILKRMNNPQLTVFLEGQRKVL